MAGASKELYEALIINPTNTAAVAEAIHQALIMPEEEQMRRMESMQLTVEKFNIQHWVNNFYGQLKESKQKQKQLSTRIITEQFESVLQSNYATAEKRLIFLDYDGTLVPFNPDPLLAKPDEELNKLLQQLYEDEQNIVVIISGRKKETLEKWVGDMPIDIIAEHGAWMRKHNEDWAIASDLSKEWKNDFLPCCGNLKCVHQGPSSKRKITPLPGITGK
jgi:trehalose 6-phosphate synthase/phosphatase